MGFNKSAPHRWDIERVCDFIRRTALAIGYDPQMPGDMLRPAMNADGYFFTHDESGFHCYKVLHRCKNHGMEHDDELEVPHFFCPFCRTVVIASILKKDLITQSDDKGAFPDFGPMGKTQEIAKPVQIIVPDIPFGQKRTG